jgi:hypothetical protein
VMVGGGGTVESLLQASGHYRNLARVPDSCVTTARRRFSIGKASTTEGPAPRNVNGLPDPQWSEPIDSVDAGS